MRSMIHGAVLGNVIDMHMPSDPMQFMRFFKKVYITFLEKKWQKAHVFIYLCTAYRTSWIPPSMLHDFWEAIISSPDLFSPVVFDNKR